MSKIRDLRINSNLLKQINELKTSRDGIEKCYTNFLENIGRTITFTESNLKGIAKINYDDISDISSIIIEHSIVSMVSCWETFFRDIFVYILFNDDEIKNSFLSSIEEDKRIEIINSNIAEDYFSKLYNFQNINNIKDAFDLLFSIDVFKTIGDYFLPYLKDSSLFKFSLNATLNGWLEAVDLVFEERHKIIHDANYRTKIQPNKLKACENVFLCFPQVLCHWISDKYKLDVAIIDLRDGTISKKNKKGDDHCIQALFTREWVIGDWYIVDD